MPPSRAKRGGLAWVGHGGGLRTANWSGDPLRPQPMYESGSGRFVASFPFDDYPAFLRHLFEVGGIEFTLGPRGGPTVNFAIGALAESGKTPLHGPKVVVSISAQS